MLVVTLSYAALYTWTYIEQTPRRYDAHEVLETRRVVCLSSKCNVCTRPSAYCPPTTLPTPPDLDVLLSVPAFYLNTR